MKSFRIYLLLALLISFTCSAQTYMDYQLRLEPVWSRVADALGEPGSVESVEFSKDGKYIISATKYDYSVIMWRTSDGAELWRQYVAQEAERAGFSADGKYVAVCSEDFLVTVYDAANGDKLKEIKHNNGIDGLTWSNQGNMLVSGEEQVKKEDGTLEAFIRVFDIPSGKEIKKFDFQGTINELFFSSDDRYLLGVGHGSVRIYDTKDWKLAQTLTTKKGEYVKFITGVFSPDDQYVLASGGSDYAKGALYLWEWKTGKLVKRFNQLGKKVESVSWHPNGDYIAYAGHDPHIWVYRVDDILNHENDRIRVAHKVWAGDHAEYIDFNEDGSFLASAHQNGLIKLWAWMGEDPDLNARRHKGIKKEQVDYNTKKQDNE